MARRVRDIVTEETLRKASPSTASGDALALGDCPEARPLGG
jgi:hypothetical protein